MSSQIERAYTDLVELKYQLYNSLFLTLPMDAIEQTGTLLPLLQEACIVGLESGVSPQDIIDNFLNRHRPHFSEVDRIGFLFKIIQYVERQIVLIDALEDAAYSQIHRVNGEHSWQYLIQSSKTDESTIHIGEILSEFCVRVVLTAHPTQFYPETVLIIISDLMQAINGNETRQVRDLLQQLGKTPFFRKTKPTPFDEAVRLTMYLEDIFYPAIGELLNKVYEAFPEVAQNINPLVRLGFWPGGDRDGNPFVTVETTRKVAARLRYSIIKCYYNDILKLKRRLTFSGVYDILSELELKLSAELTNSGLQKKVELDYFIQALEGIEQILENKHQGLFLHKVRSLQRKVANFGFYFATIDIRQDSRVLRRSLDSVRQNYPELFPLEFDRMTESDQFRVLFSISGTIEPRKFSDPVIRDTLESFGVIRDIQENNGELGAHRYIISNCRSPVDIAGVFALFRLCGWAGKSLTVDIVPLFETIDDLTTAAESMRTIYEIEDYREHLKNRGNDQTIMLGFSDGTKDGGYLMANWSIFQAKETITAVSRKAGVNAIFFDGRGGPPARGGGNSHLFYAAMGNTVENKQIQLTLQGQTISSHYGIQEAAVHNLELLLTAGIKSKLTTSGQNELSLTQRELLNTMAVSSHKKYLELKKHPLFVPYLLERSTLKYYGQANIGSRPSKRGKGKEFRFEDLRAIPFVGAWSQLKQNVPGYFGLGTALKEQEDFDNLEACTSLYHDSALFRAIISNSMQSMSKTNFNLTRYMASDPKFGEFWKIIHSEFKLTKEMVLKISGQSVLLEDNLRSRRSIRLREKVVLPLLTVQQYALMKIQRTKKESRQYIDQYEKMVMRSLFGNVNASRNSI